jgi:hypothetical protein
MTSTPRKVSLPMTVADFLDWPGDGSGQHVLPDPILLVEILSPGKAADSAAG